MDRVLVIEDSGFFLNLIVRNLRDENGFDVLTAKTLAEAEGRIAEVSGNFAMALVDLHLPDAHCGEAVDLTLQHDIPTIVFTSNYDDNIRETFLDKGVLDFVLKDNPSSLDFLLRLTRRVVKNRSTTVLIVDDSAVARRMCRELLKRYQLNVLEAKNGQEALKLLKQHADIRLIITDHEMPGMNGFELVTAIRREHRRDKLGIIGVSGSGGAPLSARFLKHGANDFMAKPYLPEELYTRIALNLDLLEDIDSLDRLNRSLQESDRIKNSFLGMAAHDLRNPIGAIQGMSKLLLEAKLKEEQEKELAGSIHKASGHMLTLLEDLLDVSAIESGAFKVEAEAGLLGDLLASRIKLISISAQAKGITINPAIATTPAIRFDALRISQVIDNLLSNAVKFSPPGSTIDATLAHTGPDVVVAIRDRGPGIREDELARVFKPFEKLSAKPTAGEKSTGLGLAIVKKIVDAHHGRIWVESVAGQGAAFSFSLPLAKDGTSPTKVARLAPAG